MTISDQNTTNRLVTEVFEAHWFERDIFYIRIYADKDISVEDVQQMIDFQTEQQVGRNHYRIIHGEELSQMTKEAREYVQENASQVKAEAYIISSLAHKILFNLYTKLRRNSNPIKAFDNVEDAISWLKSHK